MPPGERARPRAHRRCPVAEFFRRRRFDARARQTKAGAPVVPNQTGDREVLASRSISPTNKTFPLTSKAIFTVSGIVALTSKMFQQPIRILALTIKLISLTSRSVLRVTKTFALTNRTFLLTSKMIPHTNKMFLLISGDLLFISKSPRIGHRETILASAQDNSPMDSLPWFAPV